MLILSLATVFIINRKNTNIYYLQTKNVNKYLKKKWKATMKQSYEME